MYICFSGYVFCNNLSNIFKFSLPFLSPSLHFFIIPLSMVLHVTFSTIPLLSLPPSFPLPLHLSILISSFTLPIYSPYLLPSTLHPLILISSGSFPPFLLPPPPSFTPSLPPSLSLHQDATVASLKTFNKSDEVDIQALLMPPIGMILIIKTVCTIKDVKPKKVRQ